MPQNQFDDQLALTQFSQPGRTRLPQEGTVDSQTMSKKQGESMDDIFGVPRQALRRRCSRNVMKETITGKSGPSDSKLDVHLLQETSKRIDYILVLNKKTVDEATSDKERGRRAMKLALQNKFRLHMVHMENLQMEEETLGEYVYWKIHVPFSRLCKEAERIKLEVPLEGCELYDDPDSFCGWWERFEEKYLVTDNEVDFVSGPFQREKMWIYEGHDMAETFFRPSVRCFLTHHILINMDIRDKTNEQEEDPLAKKGLPYLLHRKVFEDAFIMHDETKEDPAEKEEKDAIHAKLGQDVDIEDPDEMETDHLLMPDTRQDMMDTWGCFIPAKYQPLWKIRNYFGEKIALYFAWTGTLITTLWIPMLLGVAVFFYGLYLSIMRQLYTNNQTPKSDNTTVVDQVKQMVEDSIGVIKEAFDNDATPYFALVICLWGTVFLEVWKRKNATLAYEWDVDTFEDNELDRPEFIGTEVKPDPIIPGEQSWVYPMHRYLIKFTTSFVMLIFMVILVFAAVAGVIIYRVFMTIEYCDTLPSVACLCLTTIASSLLNAVAILLLGKVYEVLAFKLTEWENHRTQTQYDDALIIKMFAFQFANSYTSLFYIAFFRGNTFLNGLFGLGSQYQDSCGASTCMAMLSFQVLVLMLVKPFPKFLKDVILPWLRKLWGKRKCCRFSAKVDVPAKDKVKLHEYMERERLKPELGDFTLGEYTEKVIVYGFLMLFAASFPLAPLIAMLISAIDIRVDARRMLWMYRRPVSKMSQDIGMWHSILTFLNFVGVVSNGFLIAFTSSWGSKYDLAGKLWIVIGFEHLVFGLKLLIDHLVPDIPADIQLNSKRERYQVQRIMEKASEVNKDSNRNLTGIKSTLLHTRPMSELQEENEVDDRDESRMLHRRKRDKKPKDQGSDGVTEWTANDAVDNDEA